MITSSNDGAVDRINYREYLDGVDLDTDGSMDAYTSPQPTERAAACKVKVKRETVEDVHLPTVLQVVDDSGTDESNSGDESGNIPSVVNDKLSNLSVEERHIRERRKEENRRAAQKCREKKKRRQLSVKEELLDYGRKNTRLKYEIFELKKELGQLVNIMKSHKCDNGSKLGAKKVNAHARRRQANSISGPSTDEPVPAVRYSRHHSVPDAELHRHNLTPFDASPSSVTPAFQQPAYVSRFNPVSSPCTEKGHLFPSPAPVPSTSCKYVSSATPPAMCDYSRKPRPRVVIGRNQPTTSNAHAGVASPTSQSPMVMTIASPRSHLPSSVIPANVRPLVPVTVEELGNKAGGGLDPQDQEQKTYTELGVNTSGHGYGSGVAGLGMGQELQEIRDTDVYRQLTEVADAHARSSIHQARPR